MVYVLEISNGQHIQLINKRLEPNTLFNPVQDADDNWVISEQEVNQNVYEEFAWTKNLNKIEWKQPVYEPII